MDDQILIELKSLNIDKIKKFSFENFNTYIRVIKVIDGDTISAIFKFKDEYYKYNFRLCEIDTPEIHSKNVNEKKLAMNAKDFLTELIYDKIVKATFLNFDKYGRILVNIYLNCDNESISDKLVNGGYAKKYDGKTKEKWDV